MTLTTIDINTKLKMEKLLLMLVYYNGKVVDEEAIENGVRFGDPALKSMMIKCNMTLDSLKKKIHLKLRLLENQVV